MKHISFSMKVGLWLSAAAMLATAASPFSNTLRAAGNDVIPFQPLTPDSWSDPIVVTQTSGNTYTSETLEVGNSVFIDVAIANNNSTPITETFNVCLFFDGVQVDVDGLGTEDCWVVNGLSANEKRIVYEDFDMTYAAVPAGEGSHVLEIQIDDAGVIGENPTNKANNNWSGNFTWEETSPSGLAGAVMDDAFEVSPGDMPADTNGTSNLPDKRDTSAYMIGTVAVSVILPESGDNGTENWTQPEIDKVKAEIEAGLGSWETWYNTYAGVGVNPVLDFVIADPVTPFVTDEPIAMAQGVNDQEFWINEALWSLGGNVGDINDFTYWERIYAHDNNIRTANGTDWAFTIFVVDSSADADGRFNSVPPVEDTGLFAYSYLNGPFLVMTYDNADWGISQMDEVLAHQVAHIFGAEDKYAAGCSGTSAEFGYLAIPNSTCGASTPVESLLFTGEGAPDAVTRAQVGWRDTDGDHIFDPADTPRPVIIDFVDETPLTLGTNHIFSGSAYAAPWPHLTRPITIRKLSAIQYRVDGGAWQNATITTGSLDDSDSENFDFATLPGLGGGSHTVDVRAANSSTDPVYRYSEVGVEGVSRIIMTFSNNNFDSATIIPNLPYLITVIDTSVGYDAIDPQDKDLRNCGGDPTFDRIAGDHSAWFSYTPTVNESITLDTIGSVFDTMIGAYLYEGFGEISQIGCDDDSAINLNSRLTVPLSAGQTYYFVVSSFNGTPPGDLEAAISGKQNTGTRSGDNDPGGPLTFRVTSNGEIVDPPTVLSSVRVHPNPTTLDVVDFTVTFSEPVTNVDIYDFSLTTNGSGVAAAGVIEVSPASGPSSVYIVSVSTGTGNGTIRLNVANNGTILNASSFPLGSSFTGGQSYRIKRTPIFDDVPFVYWANDYIERLYYAGVTGGCSAVPLNYCPDSTVTRAQMAIFLLKAVHGSSYSPPAAGASTGFTDVPVGYWADKWIKQLAAEGITGGCGAGIYCPDNTVTRAQMAIFLLKAKHGSSYVPPNATGVFSDVPVGYWADKWIEQLAVEGVTSGCGPDIYCPDAEVTRAQMAVFLVRAFSLP